MRRRRWPIGAELLAALAAGALHAQAFAAEGRGWLQVACVGWLVWRAASPVAGRHDRGAARAAALGFAFSTAWLTASTWWLFISLHRYGGLPAWLAAAAVLALSAFLSLYMAAALAGWARWRPGRIAGDAALFAALWLLAELARGVIFTGFPWAAAGYAHVDGPLARLAPWTGVYGIGAAAAGIAVLLSAALQARGRQRWSALAAAVAVTALPLALPGRFSQAAGTLSVALLQGNVPQDEKFQAEHQPEALAWAARALVEADADLVVAPETAIPLLPDQLPDGFWNALRAHFAGSGRAALVGLPLGDYTRGYTNSVAGLSRDAASMPGAFDGFYRYDKHHLVPFGEFVPFGFHWFVDMMQMPLGDFNRGPLNAPSFAVRGERAAPNVCYEDLFGEELAARFADAAGAPTLFVNVSNIGWFGDTVAIFQHLQISRMRTLELQRPMLRATNTGATAIVDHTGQVTASLPPVTRGVLTGRVQGRTGLTPFAWWAARWGLWPLLLAGGGTTAIAAWAARRRTQALRR